MAVNKVTYGGETLIDLTGDTVTADKLAQGITAHDASGAEIIGTLVASATKIETGTFSVSNTTTYEYTLTHGLGVIPTFVFAIKTSNRRDSELAAIITGIANSAWNCSSGSQVNSAATMDATKITIATKTRVNIYGTYRYIIGVI